ncbi:MAG: acyl-CoA dehydrogenase [Pseudomonadota bacterium]|nr:acyl-CoA dehydrogenase [Pseudomonadota bacterium]
MDFSYTEEQQMLRDGVARFLEKTYDFDARQAVVASDAAWSEDAWSQYAELGLLALPFAEDHGGLGGTITDCVAVAEFFGRHLTVEPFDSSIILAGAAIAASSNKVAHAWLERLMTGDAIAAFAYEEGHGTASPDLISMKAVASADGYTLSGEKRLVLAGQEADIIVIAARIEDSGTLGLFLIENGAPGLSVRGYSSVDGRSAANIRFDGVDVLPSGVLDKDAAGLIDQIIAKGMLVRAAEAVGAMGALVEMTGEYANTRKQFGVPIATFQAVAHRLADMKIAYSKARATLIYTTALAESGAASGRDMAILKGQMGKLGQEIGEMAIQTHGGVGMTDELSVSHYHKRLLALDAQFGSHAYHLRRLGQR